MPTVSSLSPVLEGLTGPDRVSGQAAAHEKSNSRMAEFIFIGEVSYFQPCCLFHQQKVFDNSWVKHSGQWQECYKG